MKKIKLKERDITKIIGMVLKEQDLSKVDWDGKQRYWFQYHNTFSGCRQGFQEILKQITRYFGEEVTNEVNQLIVSVKRALVKDEKVQKNKNNKLDKEGVIKYLKPELERIGVKWEEGDSSEKKELVDTALWDMLFSRNGVVVGCINEYRRKKKEYYDKREEDKDYDQLSADYTKISGDNNELKIKLEAANVDILQLKDTIAKLRRRLKNSSDQANIKRN